MLPDRQNNVSYSIHISKLTVFVNYSILSKKRPHAFSKSKHSNAITKLEQLIPKLANSAVKLTDTKTLSCNLQIERQNELNVTTTRECWHQITSTTAWEQWRQNQYCQLVKLFEGLLSFEAVVEMNIMKEIEQHELWLV